MQRQGARHRQTRARLTSGLPGVARVPSRLSCNCRTSGSSIDQFLRDPGFSVLACNGANTACRSISRPIPQGQRSPWQDRLAAYLAVGEKHYVSGQLAPRDALRKRLQEEMSHRLVWMAYFEADYETPNREAIYQIDPIQGIAAKLVSITPSLRNERDARRSFPKSNGRFQ